MSRIYKLKKIPEQIENWFARYKKHFPGTWIKYVYTYKGIRGKTYGVLVMRGDHSFDNSHQMLLSEFDNFGVVDGWRI